MKKNSLIQKQKRYLKTIISIVFFISLGVILLERNNLEKHNQNYQEHKLTSRIRGVSIALIGTTEYRDIVALNIATLNREIDQLLRGIIIEQNTSNSTYNNLVSTHVPKPFYNMHSTLIELSVEVNKGVNADKELLKIKRQSLYQKYPWLNNL